MNWTQRIEEHYRRNWGIDGQVCPFVAGPLHQLPCDFAVLAYPPHEGRTLWTYATRGMSKSDDSYPLELHLFSPAKSQDIVELLVVTAHFHRTATKLGLWHTVNFGRPWLDSSLCTYGLISLPYLDGPELENLVTPTASAKFFWMIPITKAELDLKKSQGVEALEERFEKAGFDYANPCRASVV
jgi:hypothetical protein